MDTFLQGTALILVGLVLSLVLDRQCRDLSLLLSLGICCMVLIAASSYISTVFELIRELVRLGNLDNGFLSILLKAAGIGFLGELASLLCADAGKNAMGKALQILSNAAVIYLSLPMVRQLLSLLEEVLGRV